MRIHGHNNTWQSGERAATAVAAGLTSQVCVGVRAFQPDFHNFLVEPTIGFVEGMEYAERLLPKPQKRSLKGGHQEHQQ